MLKLTMTPDEREDLIYELGELLYNEPIRYDERSDTYYQEIEGEEGPEASWIDRKFNSVIDVYL